ncbi:MAG: nuclear transport factor 2 family protein [Fulvivirga sp.]
MRHVLTLAMLALSGALLAQDLNPEQLAQAQLDGYNNRDIDAFLAPYSDTVKIYNFPAELTTRGKEAMRKGYSNMFDNLPDLYCTLLNRMVSGNTVIDHESVVFRNDQPAMEVFAMYKVAGGKIVEVYFIRPEEYQPE